MKQILLLAFILFAMIKVNAQNQCGTDEYDKYLKSTDPTYASEQQKMEQHIYTILKNKQNNPNARISANDCQASGVFTIPVVVHVIHKGEAVGTGTNISDAQIIDAIKGLNDRWRRVIGDGVDMEIQFALALRDTNNNATNGIIRHNGSTYPRYVTNGIYSNNNTVGANKDSIARMTFWDRKRYVNIWIADIRGVGGFATLGLNYHCFINYSDFIYNSYTTSHEMGHVFGLYHTFEGDNYNTQCPVNNDCLLDGDGVCDIPPHKRSECNTTSCITIGNLQNSFKNYMSYCIYSVQRFTQGQKDRVRANLFNKSYFIYTYDFTFLPLIYSPALIPITTPLEVGIISIENNQSEPIYNLSSPICNNFIPKIKLSNFGVNTVTNLKIATYVDGILNNTKTISTSLIQNSTNIYFLNPITFSNSGQHSLKFVLMEINGSTTDFQTINNEICKEILVSANPINNLCINIEDVNFNMILKQIDTVFNPLLTNINGCTKIGNKAIKVDFFKNNGFYINKRFYLPSFKLDSVYSAYLTFDHSYKKGAVNSLIDLQFNLIDCDNNPVYLGMFDNNSLVSEVGNDSINPWVPINCNQWKNDSIYLPYYNGLDNVQISVMYQSYGYNGTQNLYLDNFCIHKRYAIYANSNISGGITIAYSHGYQIYDEGDTLTLTANSDVWSCKQFVNWTENGVIVSTSPSYHITANKNRDLVANFITPNFTITTNINPPNSGTISGNNGSYACSSIANLIATPNTCYSFVNWTNQNGDTIATWDNTNFPMYENLNLTANFEKTRFYTYASITSTDTFPYGTGTINGASWYSNYLTCDDTAKLIATPGYCSEFAYWEERDGNGNTIILSNQPILSFIPNRIRNNINAVFRGITNSKLTLTSNIQNAGILTGAGTYSCGNIKQISAQSNSCYNFKYWMENGTLLSSSSNYNITLNTNRNILAVFEPKRYNITLVANPTNGGTVSNAGNFACDSMLTVKAKIKTGYKFTNWTEGSTIVSTDSNYTFLVSGARNLKANFSLVTGIKQSTINEISKVYPNPAKDILQVEIRSKQNTSLTLNIIDMKGSLLETKTITNTKGTFNTSFDVSKLSKGNYILNLYDEEGTASYKFVVQ